MASQRRVVFSKSALATVLVVVIAAIVALRWGPGDDPAGADRVVVGDRVMESIDTGDGVDEPDEWAASLPFAGLRGTTQVGTKTRGAAPRTEGRTRWVEVTWDVQPTQVLGAARVWPGTSAAARREKPSRLVLVAGGRTYSVEDQIYSHSSEGMATIAVARAKNVHLVVSSDGRSQRARSGEAVGPAISAPATGRCDRAPDRGKVRFSLSCEVSATRMPYVSGLGWAPRGKDWVLVTQAGRDPSEEVVANWWPGKKSGFYHRDSGGRVDYLASGKPTLTLAVTGADRPTRTYGKPTLDPATARLETRAYQVPASEPTTVTLTYRTKGKPDPRTQRLPGSPSQVAAVAKGKVTLKPIKDG